jgi:hypothetical protein
MRVGFLTFNLLIHMKNSAKIGRVILYKYYFIIVVLLFCLPIVFSLIYNLATGETLKVGVYLNNLLNDLKNNLNFVIIETLFLAIIIWIIGGFAGVLIIDKDYPPKVIGFFTFVSLWLLFLVSCAVTSGVLNYFTWGMDGFINTVLIWLGYGFILFGLAGMISGFTVGLLFGNALKLKR